MDKIPCFYLIIRPNFLHYEPLIPPSFIRHVGTLATQKATLKCSSGGIWSIHLHKTRNSVFFGNGWKEFMTAHSLREDDFLLFNHDGNMCFDVQIFDPCGLERLEDRCEQEKARLNRRDLQTPVHCQGNRDNRSREKGKAKETGEKVIYEVRETEEMFMSYAKTRNQKMKSGKLKKPIEDNIYEIPEREENFMPNERTRSQKMKYSGKLKEPKEDNMFEVPEREENFLPHERSRSQKMKYSDNHCHKRGKLERPREEVEDMFEVKTEMEDYFQPYETPQYQKAKQSKKDVVMKEKRSSTSQNRAGNEIYGTSESFRSRFPFFLKHLKEYHVEKNFILQVPTGFARKYLPSEKTKITLCNPEGKSWKVSLNPGPNQTNFGGGWKTYVSDNNLRRGQVCAFELVDDLKLRVHTFWS